MCSRSNPLGIVSWISVVEAFSFSLGTVSCSSWPSPDGTVLGNSSAWAKALGASARTATRTPARANARHAEVHFMVVLSFSYENGLRDGEGGRAAHAHGAGDRRRRGGCPPGEEQAAAARGDGL